MQVVVRAAAASADVVAAAAAVQKLAKLKREQRKSWMCGPLIVTLQSLLNGKAGRGKNCSLRLPSTMTSLAYLRQMS